MYYNRCIMTKHRIFSVPFSSVYPHYVAKVEKKGHTVAELQQIITWLTGYTNDDLQKILENDTDFETFYTQAPHLNPSRKLITGVICGVRVEDIEDPLMQNLRYLDKLIDELYKGKAMEKILRA